MNEHLLDLEKDSVMYYRRMVSLEIYQGNFNAAINDALKAIKLDSTRIYYCDLIALCYAYLEDFIEALQFLAFTEDSIRRSGPIERPGYIPGYIYVRNGYEKEANDHFKKGIARRMKEIEYSAPIAQQGQSQLYLVGIYLALGDEIKALEHLETLKKLENIDHGFIIMLTCWPGFESIRNKPEFHDVLKDLEVKYQKQHKRIGELIKDMDFNQLLY